MCARWGEHKGSVVGEGNGGKQLSGRHQSEAEPGEAANVGVAYMHRRSGDSQAALHQTPPPPPSHYGDRSRWEDKTLLFPLSDAQPEADPVNFENFLIHRQLHFRLTAAWLRQ